MNAYGVISLVRLIQPLSAVVWQLLACAKPCCCYTWPACQYLYLCCPAWQLVDCVSVLVERYVSTLIIEDYYFFYALRCKVPKG